MWFIILWMLCDQRIHWQFCLVTVVDLKSGIYKNYLLKNSLKKIYRMSQLKVSTLKSNTVFYRVTSAKKSNGKGGLLYYLYYKLIC